MMQTMAASTAISAKPSTTSVRWREPVEVSSFGRASVESGSENGNATGNPPQNNRPPSGSRLGSGPGTQTRTFTPPGYHGHGDFEARFDQSENRGSPSSGVPENVMIMPVEDVQTSAELGRKVIRSRSRPRRPDEPPPFLSVDTLPVDKIVVDGKAPAFKGSGRPSSGRRFTGSPKKYQKDPAGLNNSMNSSIGGRKTPQSKPGSARPTSRASSSSINYNSFFTHKNAAFLSAAAPPSLWSNNNKFWPHQSPAGDKRRTPAFPPVMAVEGNSAKPNQLVTQPFKQDSDAAPLVERCVSPSQELKERTLIAVKEMARDLSKKGSAPSSPTRSGRLLKGKLKPLHTFKLQGPNIEECMGVQAEERPSYTPSQARLLQRKRELLSMLPPDVLQQRPMTQDSYHHTSIASSDDRVNSAMMTDDTVMDLPAQATTIHMSAFTRIPPNSLASFASTSDIIADGTMSPSLHGGELGNADKDSVKSVMIDVKPSETSEDVVVEASAPPEATMSDYLNEGGAASILSEMVNKVKHSAQKISEEVTEAVDDAYHESMLANLDPISPRSGTPASRSVMSDDGMMFESASQRSVRFSDSDSFIPNGDEESDTRPESEASMHSSVTSGTLVGVDVTAVADEMAQHEDMGLQHDQNQVDTSEEVPNDDIDAENVSKIDDNHPKPQIQNTVNLQEEVEEILAPVVQKSPTLEGIKAMSPPTNKDQDLKTTEQQAGVQGNSVTENYIEPPFLVTNAVESTENVTLQETQDQNEVEVSNEVNNNVNKEQVDHTDAKQNANQTKNVDQAESANPIQPNDKDQNNDQIELPSITFFKTEAQEDAENNDLKTKSEETALVFQNEENALPEAAKDLGEESTNNSEDQHLEQSMPVKKGELSEQKQGDIEISEQKPSAISEDCKVETAASNAEITEATPTSTIQIEITQQQSELTNEVVSETNNKTEYVSEINNKSDLSEAKTELSNEEEQKEAEDDDELDQGESCNKKDDKDKKDEHNDDDGGDGPSGSHGNSGTGEGGQSGNNGDSGNSGDNNDDSGNGDGRNGQDEGGQGDGDHGNQDGGDTGNGKEQTENATDMSDEQRTEQKHNHAIFPSHLYKNKVSKCWYGDLEDDVPEIEDSVLFCGICGLDEDACLCPHSTVAPNRTQSGRTLPTYNRVGTTNNRLMSAPGVIERDGRSPEEVDLSLGDNTILMKYKDLLGHDNGTGCFSSELSSSPRKQSSSNQAHFLLRGVSVMSGEERLKDGSGTRMEDAGVDSGCESEHMDADDLNCVDGDVNKMSEDGDKGADPSTLQVVAESKKLSRPRSAKKKPAAPSPAPFPPLCFRINIRPPAGKLFYFAYGVDMNPKRMTTYLGSTVERRWGVLFGFKLKFNKRGSDLEAGGFPNIEFCPESSVEGCVYVITQDQLKTLDMFMGSPQFYTHAMFPVWMSNCYQPEQFGVAQYCVPALTYIALDKWTHTDTSQPLSCHYSIEQSLKGSDLLTTDYIQHMKAQLVT